MSEVRISRASYGHNNKPETSVDEPGGAWGRFSYPTSFRTPDIKRKRFRTILCIATSAICLLQSMAGAIPERSSLPEELRTALDAADTTADAIDAKLMEKFNKCKEKWKNNKDIECAELEFTNAIPALREALLNAATVEYNLKQENPTGSGDITTCFETLRTLINSIEEETSQQFCTRLDAANNPMECAKFLTGYARALARLATRVHALTDIVAGWIAAED